MSKIGRHAEGQASISYFAPAAHKAALQQIAAEMFPHAPKPFSTLLPAPSCVTPEMLQAPPATHNQT